MVRSLNLAIAVLMNKSIEGGRGVTDAWFVGCFRNGLPGVLGLGAFRKPLLDVLTISF